jgi:hypothetical protein
VKSDLQNKYLEKCSYSGPRFENQWIVAKNFISGKEKDYV